MPNPKIKQITLPSGNTYDIWDEDAHKLIYELESPGTYLGVTTSTITDGSSTNPITVEGQSVTATAGDWCITSSDKKAYIFSGSTSKWQEFTDMTNLGALAYKDSASGSVNDYVTGVSTKTFTGTAATLKLTPAGSISLSNTNKTATVSAASSGTATYTPVGTVSQPTFSGTALTSTGKFTPSGSVSATANNSGNYQPAGTVSQPTFSGTATTSTGNFTPSGTISVGTGTANYTPAGSNASSSVSGSCTVTATGSVSTPTISVKTAGTTGKVTGITSVGSMPTYTVSNEVLVITAGTTPTADTEKTFKTGDAAYKSSQPSFTGSAATGTISGTAAAQTFTGTGAQLKFTGSQGSVSVSGTPSGTVSQPTFTGTKVQLGFSGTEGNVSVSGTPAGTVSQPTFTGTGARLVTGNISVPNSATFSGTEGSISYTPEGSINVTLAKGNKTITVS